MTPLRPAVLAFLWIAAVVATGYHLYVQARALGLHEPMGMWETNYVALARTWPHHYQPGHFVGGFDPHGPGYPAFVWPRRMACSRSRAGTWESGVLKLVPNAPARPSPVPPLPGGNSPHRN